MRRGYQESVVSMVQSMKFLFIGARVNVLLKTLNGKVNYHFIRTDVHINIILVLITRT